MLADESFTKAVQISKTCVLVNNNLWGKVSSIESTTTFGKSFKATWVPCFVSYFNFLSCKLENFTFKLLNYVILN